jgi:hypothetical protein
LFLLVLAAAAARRAAGASSGASLPEDEPPAVIGLLAGGPPMRLYQATLLDLAARGWFLLRQPEVAGIPGPAMCELAAQQPPETLTPYERRALAHVAFRAGVRHEVPVPALCDGFLEGEDSFLAGFRRQVAADARGRGLSEPRLRTAMRALLCAAALVPAAAAAAAFVPRDGAASLWYVLIGWVAACVVARTLGARQVPSRAGRAALAWHRPSRPGPDGWAADEPGQVAYAAALGRSAAALAPFGEAGGDETWSSFGGRWRPVTIGSPDETPFLGGALKYCGLMFPVLAVTAVLGFSGVVHGAGGVGLRAGAVAVFAGGLLLIGRGISRWSRLPGFAEFGGQVVRQWIINGDDDAPTRHCVAVDDGTSPRAWAFSVSAAQYGMLAPGTFVHVRVNPRRNRALSIQPTEPAPVAPRLAAVVAEQQQADEHGLPDPAVLLTEQEASAVLGGPVRVTRQDLVGRLTIWRPAAASRPSLQVMVQGGALAARAARQAERHGTPLPANDGWMLSSHSVVLCAGTLTARVTLTAPQPAAADAALARLVPLVAQRLRAAADR